MKERPILFKAEMVRALLDGSKTQTRRICKPAEKASLSRVIPAYKSDDGEQRPPYITPGWFGDEEGNVLFYSPYGQTGDRLWVKETHLYVGPGSGSDLPDYVAEARNPVNHTPDNCWYRADGDDATVIWKPSIHMFRGLSRITLEITGVRVERLNDISEEDAKAEGLKGITKDGKLVKYGIPDADGYPGTDDIGWPWEDWRISPVDAYRRLWESINGSGSWDANPWVWVVEFKRVKWK